VWGYLSKATIQSFGMSRLHSAVNIHIVEKNNLSDCTFGEPLLIPPYFNYHNAVPNHIPSYHEKPDVGVLQFSTSKKVKTDVTELGAGWGQPKHNIFQEEDVNGIEAYRVLWWCGVCVVTEIV